MNCFKSNSIEFIEENYYKYSNKSLVSIATNNFDAKHVLGCLILTENLFSMKKDASYIVDKIIKLNNCNSLKQGVKV